MTRQAGKETVYKLVDDFEKNECQYMSKSFQETEARNRLIDPFFTALGWELNQTSIARKFWDVHREYSQRDNSTTKKPDYAFRIKEGAKYRDRHSTLLDRKEAIRELADVLEYLKSTLKDNMTTDDEKELLKIQKDLFNIANNFQIRHNNVSQNDNYNRSWMSWIFYLYLSSIHLLLRIRRKVI